MFTALHFWILTPRGFPLLERHWWCSWWADRSYPLLCKGEEAGLAFIGERKKNNNHRYELRRLHLLHGWGQVSTSCYFSKSLIDLIIWNVQCLETVFVHPELFHNLPCYNDKMKGILCDIPAKSSAKLLP